ncbi:hypothetical protein MMC20_004144 [Loxospora ochrophaea]|nr:hypothetical protein [Loxospora ochrophaea]
MSSLRSILVTGATGKQGGAVIKALLSSKPSPFNIIALTRDAASNGAKALASKPNVSVVEGDLEHASAIFSKVDQIWGVFSVQAVGKGEEAQGKALVDAAVANGVKHFVYSSVDRGGPEKSDKDPTNVPHFVSKYNIEKHLQRKAAESSQKMEWTILRTTAFMDNMMPGMMGKVFGSMLAYVGDKKLQLISTKDIGVFAALAFQDPSRFLNQAISIAGDEINYDEARVIFKSEIGHDLPTTFDLLLTAIRWGSKEMGTMLAFFKDQGFRADVAWVKQQNPEMQDFRTWLRESSGYVSR